MKTWPGERLDSRQFAWLSATVAATLLAHIGHLPLWISLPCLLLVALRAWSRQRGATGVKVWLRLPLTLLLVVAVLAQFHNVFGREPGSVFGCGLLALKLLETERLRDGRVVAGFAAFVLMSALLFAQTLLFTLAVCAVLVLVVTALVAMQPAPLPSARPLRASFATGAWLLVAGLPLAALSFVLVPRLATPLWGSPNGDAIARTGLGERMSPGEMTELLVDDSTAMRVDFSGTVPAPSLRYFRAIVLTDFDGSAWTRAHAQLRAPVDLAPIDATAQAGIVDYTITLEPSDRRLLPALDIPIEAPANAALMRDRIVVAATAVTQARQYHLRSATQLTLSAYIGDAERQRALALPAGFDPKSRALAVSWRSGGRDDNAVIAAALDYFHASFTYTLNVPGLGRDSIDEFLFDTQRGFCEHYASAFVFLMRAAGIPARVVTGYQGGWWNAARQYLLVRQSDAHAWGEVWLPHRGWVRVDPTAAVSPSRIERGAAAANGVESWLQGEWVRGLRNQLDVVNRLWTLGIVRFDALRQRNLLTPFGMGEANPGDLLLALSGVLSVVMLIATMWALRAARRQSGDSIDRLWASLQRRMGKHHLGAAPSEGALAWLARIRVERPDLGEKLAPVVAVYVDARYAHAAASPAILARLRSMVRGLRLR